MKRYLIVRWKKRWPIVPATIIWIFFGHLIFPNKPLSGFIFVAAVLVFVGILFPIRWGGED